MYCSVQHTAMGNDSRGQAHERKLIHCRSTSTIFLCSTTSSHETQHVAPSLELFSLIAGDDVE